MACWNQTCSITYVSTPLCPSSKYSPVRCWVMALLECVSMRQKVLMRSKADESRLSTHFACIPNLVRSSSLSSSRRKSLTELVQCFLPHLYIGRDAAAKFTLRRRAEPKAKVRISARPSFGKTAQLLPCFRRFFWFVVRIYFSPQH